MSNIVRFDDFIDAEIRVTDDGFYSVFDVIRFCSQAKGGSERKTWERIVEQYSEVVAKCHNLKFKGAGQRETPVATRENTLYIIGLLQGAIGRAYREESAKVFLQYLEASPELASSVIDRATPEDLAKIELRLKTKKVRVTFTSMLQEHGVVLGWEFANCTDAIYTPVLGNKAAMVKKVMNLTKKDNLRDHLSTVELSAIMLAEAIATEDISKNSRSGYRDCLDSSSRAGAKVKRVFE